MEDRAQHVGIHRLAGGLPLVVAPTEIDIATVPRLSAALRQAGDTEPTIIVDLTATNFCDCSVFAVLIVALKRAARSGGEVRLVIPPANIRIRQLFLLTGMDAAFRIFRTVAAAAEAAPAGRLAAPGEATTDPPAAACLPPGRGTQARQNQPRATSRPDRARPKEWNALVKKTITAAAAVTAAAGLAWLTSRVVSSTVGQAVSSSTHGAGPNHWLTVTVNCPPERLGPGGGQLPEPITRLASRAEVSVRPAPGNRGGELRERTGGRGPDVCIEAVGMEAHSAGPGYPYDQVKQQLRLQTDRPTAVREAVHACRKGGSVFPLGVFGGLVDKFPLGALINKGLTLRGAQQHGQP